MTTKNATIQYRCLSRDSQQVCSDLKAMVVDVLRRRRWDTSAKNRVIDLDQDGSFVILNKVSAPETWDTPLFGGQILHLQEGSDVHAVMQSLEDDTPEFVLQHLSVGDQARVLRGALYFAIVGNHLGIIEGQQVRGRTLERYLTALLQKADELPAGKAITLDGKFFAGNGKEIDEANEIEISAQPSYGNTRPEQEDVTAISEREAATADHAGRAVFDVLQTLGWSDEAVDSLRDEVPQGGWVEGKFKVLIKQFNRKRKPIGRPTINHMLRNVDPDDLSIKGEGSEKGGIVKLSVVRPVHTVNSLLEPLDAMTQIVGALRDWAAKGKIDCRFEL
jgi:hypothetical protein